MNYKLKRLGLAAMAALACCAALASAAQANFTASGGAGVGLSGTSSADQFNLFGSALKCTENTFTGTTTAATSNELTITPTYKNCKYGTLPATVDFTGCDYKLTATSPQVHIQCPAGKEIDIRVFASAAAHTAGTPLCHFTIDAQLVGGIVYTNSAGRIILSGTFAGMHSTEHRTSAVCPNGPSTTVTTTTASYAIQAGGITIVCAVGVISRDP